MKVLRIPVGKTLYIKTGKYTFSGPYEISFEDKFDLPEFFTDGSLVSDYVYDTEQPISDAGANITSIGGEKKRKKSVRRNSGQLSGGDTLRESPGEGDESSVFRGELLDDVRPGAGCGKTEEGGDSTQSDTE